ncbi:response regulator transcription factor [Nocardia asiatica]|uniref:response regulator transcription factor n=1 Tax=Nocardia asiatica TaxID=209252 RepID=UPI0002DE7531|nr:helix-turn-helix transcriptional regulator [Nocardia asiatica]
MVTAFDALAAIGLKLAVRTPSADLHQELAHIFRSASHGDTVALTQFNPVTGRHETVINLEYPKAVLHHLNTWFVEHDEVYRYMRTVDRTPLRWKDMPFRYESMFSAEHVFRPSGFNEGVTSCLYNQEGRYTGALHISTTDRNQPPDEAMQLLSASQTLLGTLIDWWATSDTPSTEDQNAFRVVVDPARKLWFQPSSASAEPTKELLDEAISVSLPRSLKSIPNHAYLHWQDSTFAVRSCRRGNHIVLDVRAEDVPARLTARELDVSTLLIEGLTNAQIAEILCISTKTASRHVENIMAKLGVSTRTTAAVRCAEVGLRSWESTDRIAR